MFLCDRYQTLSECFISMIFKPSSNMGHLETKARSQGQIVNNLEVSFD